MLNVLQQRALDQANALASEALRHPRSVAAHAAEATVASEYARRCEEYMRVIGSTLTSECARGSSLHPPALHQHYLQHSTSTPPASLMR